jgi:hypothetical protein
MARAGCRHPLPRSLNSPEQIMREQQALRLAIQVAVPANPSDGSSLVVYRPKILLTLHTKHQTHPALCFHAGNRLH